MNIIIGKNIIRELFDFYFKVHFRGFVITEFASDFKTGF